MMKRYFLFLVLLVSFFTVVAQEKPIKDTVLEKLIQQAVNNFPRIKELEEQLRINDVREKLIKTNYHPTVSADADYRFQAPVPQIAFGGNGEKFKFQPYHNVTGGVTVNQLVYDFGKTKAQLERNKTEQAYRQDDVDNNKNAIAYQVTAIYYAIIFIDKAITVQQ